MPGEIAVAAERITFQWTIPITCSATGKTVALLAGFVFLIYLLRNAVAMGLKDFDSTLIKSPVFGPLYENWFRKETYYRHDTRLMYLDTVNAVVKAKVEEMTGAKGIKLVRFMEHSPILAELYKPTSVTLPKT